ncbi:XRE family transcriptional regulator [Achromobacter spanius]|uniref:helix-turn-helix transcriptional regulator n=1 Tax=Achromobacter spanius TaxID=217203 RepID=UPI000F8F8740|nr:helix-turn-helix transcriptional regulator [Achromobacter spanius]AZS78825.1 XRE family transcriptional regulator [Achromobacter spanius]
MRKTLPVGNHETQEKSLPAGGLPTGAQQATLVPMKMDDIYAQRLERFRSLMESRFGGKQAAIAAAVGKPANYVSRVLNGSKKLGEEMAREFEVSLELPPYWFDGLDALGAWPFSSVDRASFEALTPEQRRGIEQWVARQVAAYEDIPSVKSPGDEKAA